MFGPKDKDQRERPNAPESKNEPSTEPKKGGFGAFANKYRERWEAEHPNAGKSDKHPAPPGSQPSNDNPSDSTKGRQKP